METTAPYIEEAAPARKPLKYYAIVAAHEAIRYGNRISCAILVYMFFADVFNLYQFGYNVPWFEALPIIVFLVRLQFGGDKECPLTTMENEFKNPQ